MRKRKNYAYAPKTLAKMKLESSALLMIQETTDHFRMAAESDQ
jgi:hypothetical protein